MNSNIPTERSAKLGELFASNHFLVLAILITVNAVISIISNASSVVSAVFAIFPALLIGGIWTLRKSAASKSEYKYYNSYSFSLIKIQPIVLTVGYVLIAFVMVLLAFQTSTIIPRFTSELKLVLNDRSLAVTALNNVDDGYRYIVSNVIAAVNDEEVLYAIADFLEQYGIVVAYIVEALVVGVCAVLAVCAIKVAGITSKIRNTLMFNHDEPIKTSFVSAVLYVMAGFQTISLLTLVGSTRFNLGTVGDIVGIALLITAALFFGKIKDVME